MDRLIVDDIGGKTSKFNGDPKLLKKQKIAPEDFAKDFTGADDIYTQLLRLLSAELKK